MGVEVCQAGHESACRVAEFVSGAFRKSYDSVLARLTDSWSAAGPNLGWLLKDNDRIVGYIGALYSRRLIGGALTIVCNMRNWAAVPEYRHHSLALLSRLISDPGMVVTNFTASAKAERLLTRFGFQHITSGSYLLPNIDGWIRRGLKIERGPQFADEADREILDQHRQMGCSVAVTRIDSQPCAFVFLRRQISRISCADVLYATDRRVFWESMSVVRATAFAATGAHALLIEDRFLKRKPYFGKFIERAGYCRPANGGDPQDADRLYSEVVLRHSHLLSDSESGVRE